MENLKIGITIGLKDAKETIWSNGMKLNILILVKLLKKSKKNYTVYLLNTIDINLDERAKYLDDIEFHKFEDKYREMDLLICMGSQVEKKYLQDFKSMGPDKKIISYKCGNNYILATEDVLFKESKATFDFETELDEVWYVPQQHETNYGYYHTLYRTNPVIVPFVWDQQFLVEALIDVEKSFRAGAFKKTFKYDSSKEKKTIGIMEPNLNIVKYCLLPSMIAEESYRTPIGKERIEKLLITNAQDVSKHGAFTSVVQTFDLYKDQKIVTDSRYQTAYVLTQFIDVLVCHQLLNPLNYLYLDAAYMGYPVLHNAPMCKDLGYYYEGSDTVAGAKQLNWILEYHDKNIDEYNAKNAKALWRYSINNEDLVSAYDKLIFDLFNGGNLGLKYDPSTNAYL